MITADTLTTLTTFTAHALTMAVRQRGGKLKNVSFVGKARFVGITNGYQFCYLVDKLEADDTATSTKVYITYDPAAGKVIADID